jgi:hypothetical protein
MPLGILQPSGKPIASGLRRCIAARYGSAIEFAANLNDQTILSLLPDLSGAP